MRCPVASAAAALVETMDEMNGCLCHPVNQPSLNFTRFFLDFLLNESDYFTADSDTAEDNWWSVLRGSTFAVSITTIVVNALSLLAISLGRGIMSANLRIICSLSLSDLLCGVCGILEDSMITRFGSCQRLVSKYLLLTAHLTALLTLLGLAVDQYLAICRPLYHRTDLNISRVNVAVVFIWIASVLCSSLEIIPPVNMSLLSKL